MAEFGNHKRQQADHYDHVVDDHFEVHRPHGFGRYYQFQLRYKIERLLNLLPFDTTGLATLVVCAGSGMDAELLEAMRLRVVALDLSWGAVQRSLQRRARYDLAYSIVQGDVERLPFADRSFDLCLVHDGLHHLETERRAVLEMGRVARRAVLVAEPAAALVTDLATRVGLAHQKEVSGNQVKRLRATALAAALRPLGYRSTRYSRYLMRYGHPPGLPSRLLGTRLGWPIGRVIHLILTESPIARVGNKLAFVAVRDA